MRSLLHQTSALCSWPINKRCLVPPCLSSWWREEDDRPKELLWDGPSHQLIPSMTTLAIGFFSRSVSLCSILFYFILTHDYIPGTCSQSSNAKGGGVSAQPRRTSGWPVPEIDIDASRNHNKQRCRPLCCRGKEQTFVHQTLRNKSALPALTAPEGSGDLQNKRPHSGSSPLS